MKKQWILVLVVLLNLEMVHPLVLDA